LKEQPSAAWTNRWVSVVGLMDPPYDSKKYGYRHLSVTVEKDGQIQFLDEAQARFRLASIGKTTTPRNRDVVKGIINGTGNTKPAPATVGTSTRSRRAGQPTGASTPGMQKISKNAEIVRKFKDRGQVPPSGGYPTPPMGPWPSPPPASKGLLERVPWWVWVIGAAIVLLLIGGKR
jgi:hypothetical protein